MFLEPGSFCLLVDIENPIGFGVTRVMRRVSSSEDGRIGLAQMWRTKSGSERISTTSLDIFLHTAQRPQMALIARTVGSWAANIRTMEMSKGHEMQVKYSILEEHWA
jgi:hypothetical protein